MRDLLTDNVSLLDQLDTLGGPHVPPGLPGTFKPRLREVTALPTWTYCFLAYVALQTDDQKVKDQLAYARLIIREAQRHSGSGWLDYDRVFRQQAALDPALKWNSLHPGIQASTLVGQVANAHMLCRLCREPDHSTNQCALWYLQPPTSNSGVPGSSSTQRFPGWHQDSRANLCLSWNSGQCNFPVVCRFRHICSICLRPHMARDCRYDRPSGGGAFTGGSTAPLTGPRPLR